MKELNQQIAELHEAYRQAKTLTERRQIRKLLTILYTKYVSREAPTRSSDKGVITR